MINLTDIQFRYPKREAFALADVSLAVAPGEIFTLLGPNGAGKTTLIRILSGLIIPQQGTVTVSGYDMRRDEYNARKSIGLVLGDERTFYYRLSGAQNLEFFGGLYGLRRSHLKTRIPEVLEMVGLANDAKLQYMRYSGGMKKRLALARALLHEPQVLFLDEPNSGVDPKSARAIRELIVDLKRRNRTILLTTHDMDEAEKMSDNIGFLREGRLVRTGTITEFKKIVSERRLEVGLDEACHTWDDPSIQKFLNTIRQAAISNDVTFQNDRLVIRHNGHFDVGAVMLAMAQSGVKIKTANTIEPSLEDVFLKLTE